MLNLDETAPLIQGPAVRVSAKLHNLAPDILSPTWLIGFICIFPQLQQLTQHKVSQVHFTFSQRCQCSTLTFLDARQWASKQNKSLAHWQDTSLKQGRKKIQWMEVQVWQQNRLHWIPFSSSVPLHFANWWPTPGPLLSDVTRTLGLSKMTSVLQDDCTKSLQYELDYKYSSL